MAETSDRTEPSRRALLCAALAAPIALASAGVATSVRHASHDGAIDLFDIIPASFHAGILAGKRDDTPAVAIALAGHIQTAIDAAVGQRRRLFIPAGLYNVAPIDSFASEAGPCRRCFAIRSHMHIDAEPGATFRIIDRISTDAAVVFMSMFGTNEQLVDLSWRGLAMDMNGQHNPISPERAAGKYSLLNQAHIFVSGTPDGRAARASDVIIERCRFTNTPGVSCIVLAQSNAHGIDLGRNWQIIDSQFIDGGLDTPDHSAIFAWAEDVVCQRCEFANEAPKTDVGGNVAFEVHGSRQQFVGNTVRNYYQGVWIDGNRTEQVSGDVLVSNNIFKDMAAFGIMFYGTECRMRSVRILGNTISFGDATFPGVDLKIGIGCLAPMRQSDVVIDDNTIMSLATRTASAGISLQSSAMRDERHDAFLIERNRFNRTTFGVQIMTKAGDGLGSITIRKNRSLDLTRAGAFTVPQGVGVDYQAAAAPIGDLTIVDNVCVDDRGKGAQCAFGIRLQGRIDRLRVSGNSASGMTSAPYVESRLTVAARL